MATMAMMITAMKKMQVKVNPATPEPLTDHKTYQKFQITLMPRYHAGLFLCLCVKKGRGCFEYVHNNHAENNEAQSENDLPIKTLLMKKIAEDGHRKNT